MNYYPDELDKFEDFLEGEMMLGTIKVTRKFENCQDRMKKTKYCDQHFAYMTTMVDTSVDDKDIVATLALVHGFGQN